MTNKLAHRNETYQRPGRRRRSLHGAAGCAGRYRTYYRDSRRRRHGIRDRGPWRRNRHRRRSRGRFACEGIERAHGGVVTKPFSFEGAAAHEQAERGLAELAGSCDTVITIPNEKLIGARSRGTSFFEAFRMADDVLRQAVQGIADIITTPGLINRDFSDIRTIMLGMGYAMMGTATATGEGAHRCGEESDQQPTDGRRRSPGARGVLINITASSQLSIHDVNEACNLIRAATQNDDVQINFGVVMDEQMGDEVKITVIATGFQRDPQAELNRFPSISSVFDQPPSSQPSEEPVQEQAAERAEGEQPPPDDANDFDTPAFLRKKRALVQ